MMRILVAGHAGQVACSLRALPSTRFEIVTRGRPELDLADPASIERSIDAVQPVAIVNAAAYTAVDKAESEPEIAFAVNRDGAAALAASAARRGLPIIHLSTDYVFAGDKPEPYTETDGVCPQSVYGRSKREGETAVMAANAASVVLRTAWIHSRYGSNFLKTMLRLAETRDTMRVVADQQGTPTYAPDIAEAITIVLDRMLAEPLSSGWRGLFHLVNEGDTTWAGFAEFIFARSQERGGPHARVEPITTAEYPTAARRPANSRLDTGSFQKIFNHRLPDWQSGTIRCLESLTAV